MPSLDRSRYVAKWFYILAVLRRSRKWVVCQNAESDNYCRPYTPYTTKECQLAEVVFLDVVAERPEAHPEHLRGFHLHAARAFERLRDIAALDLLHVSFEV